MFIINFFVGILILGGGVVFVRFNHRIVNSFSRNNIFERKLGPGSTYAVFMILSILIIIFGFLMMLNLHDNLFRFLFGPIIQALGYEV